MPVMETLALIGAISGGASALAQLGTGLYAGVKGLEETKKAREYQEKWTDKLYADEMKQQTLQNRMEQQNLAAGQAAQRFSQEAALRAEGRTDSDRWYARMQNAGNKYAEILNKSRAMRSQNAAALQNR